ncbi:uncharacterized protein BO97DRAFT_240129 [Aspergillus homomorphus CBS 101889]|uniref:Uncharacterized protein n=1 Tax=Aspergillus homomorphus (strain CBS 101889) TaxID=1450537 RepID=A0A395I4Z1_ASPHC|nr:hypothetical protein BO97DRAFT_240129 [Aspergillus homomorphus CBS 101889]RAL15150.1 hypothetical protein BO97DRAFT_240129 [Aspergillus homomorphus CBS 101889]
MVVPASDLPEGVSPSDVHKCKNHPLGRNRQVKDASLAPLDDAMNPSILTTNPAISAVETRSETCVLEERACYKDAPYGCSGGYCWKTCGRRVVLDGQEGWCWALVHL